MKKFLSANILVALFVSATPGFSATITYLGVDSTTIKPWRSTNIAKPLALDYNGNNAYGELGYFLDQNLAGYEVEPAGLSVTYLTGIPGANVYGTTQPIDDPNLPYGVDVADSPTMGGYGMNGTMIPSVDINAQRDIFSLTFNQADSFRVAVLIDSTGDGKTRQVPDFLGIKQTIGGIATSEVDTTAYQDANQDALFFDVTASAGDVFVIYGRNLDTNLTITGLMFDPNMFTTTSSVPEPSVSLLGFLLAGLLPFASKRQKHGKSHGRQANSPKSAGI